MAPRGIALPQDPEGQKALRKKFESEVSNLEGKLDALWIHFGKVTSIMVAVTALVITVAKPSKLSCSAAWVGDALLALVAIGHFISLCRLVYNLTRKYEAKWRVEANLEQIEQKKGQLTGESLKWNDNWKYWLMIVAAATYFVCFFVAMGIISHDLPCLRDERLAPAPKAG